ncbi:MAG: TonB family protein [Bacteroidetes bacterium]|nr:TonB family protein [Bacteroidota bacterium]
MESKKSPKFNEERYSGIYRLAGVWLTLLIVVGFLKMDIYVKGAHAQKDRYDEDLPPIVFNIKEAPKMQPKQQVVQKMINKVASVINPIFNEEKAEIKFDQTQEQSIDAELVTEEKSEAPVLELNTVFANDSVFQPHFVDKMPQYPGGMNAMYKWLGKHLVYPNQLTSIHIEGVVLVEFVVGKDGYISEITVLHQDHPLFSKAVLETMTKMPKWQPGIFRGQAVACSFRMPVYFRLN